MMNEGSGFTHHHLAMALRALAFHTLPMHDGAVVRGDITALVQIDLMDFCPFSILPTM